jgi:hypothetical protein
MTTTEMTTEARTEILDHLYEALNGLTMGWQLANVRDDAKRAELQAPVKAAMLSVYELLAKFETEKVDLEWAREHYGK